MVEEHVLNNGQEWLGLGLGVVRAARARAKVGPMRSGLSTCSRHSCPARRDACDATRESITVTS